MHSKHDKGEHKFAKSTSANIVLMERGTLLKHYPKHCLDGEGHIAEALSQTFCLAGEGHIAEALSQTFCLDGEAYC